MGPLVAASFGAAFAAALDFTPAPGGPVWPAAPELARVAYVGVLTAPRPGFGRPQGVACDADRVVVTDLEAHAVYAFDLASGTSRRIGGRYAGSPLGAAIDGQGQVLLVDGDAPGVLAVVGRRDGRVKPVLEGPPFVRPTGLAVRGGGLIVVDAGAHALFEVTDAAISGTVGGRGTPGVGFNVPVAVATDGEAVYVSDTLNASVEKVVEGVPVVIASGPSYGGSGLIRPKGIAVDAQGRVHVVDSAMQHVQVYTSDGTWLGHYGEPGDGPGQLALPSGICIFGARVFVADDLHRQVVVYLLLDAPEHASGVP